MKRICFFAVLVLMAAGVLAGCGAPQESVTVVGSTSVLPFMELLADEYMRRNPDVQINIQGGGSSAGVKAVNDGTADLGMASRELTDDEKGQGIRPVVIARDGIAVIVHPGNSVGNLGLEQLQSIFSGRVVSWGALGGTGRITVVVREEGSGTRSAFDELAMGGNRVTRDAVVQGSTGAVRSTVAADPGAIGYISLAQVDKTVAALPINGVAPSAKDILSSNYVISRPFSVMTKGEPKETVSDFIRFILGPGGQSILSKEGLVVER